MDSPSGWNKFSGERLLAASFLREGFSNSMPNPTHLSRVETSINPRMISGGFDYNM